MDTRFSRVVKAKDRTYFVDVKDARNNSSYLIVTESKKSKEDASKFTKSSIMVFKEASGELFAALTEAATHLH